MSVFPEIKRAETVGHADEGGQYDGEAFWPDDIKKERLSRAAFEKALYAHGDSAWYILTELLKSKKLSHEEIRGKIIIARSKISDVTNALAEQAELDEK